MEQELSRNTIFILPRLFDNEPWIIRICLPGVLPGILPDIANRKAVWLEERFTGTYEEAKALVLEITQRLPSVRATFDEE